MANLKYIEFPDKVDQYAVSPSDKTIFGAENINSIKEAINNNADVLSEVKSSIPKKLSDLENDLEFDMGILEETDPTVPAWAKASTKPTYNWSEIQEKPTLLSREECIALIEEMIANSAPQMIPAATLRLDNGTLVVSDNNLLDQFSPHIEDDILVLDDPNNSLDDFVSVNDGTIVTA